MGSRGQFGSGRSRLSVDGGAVWSERGQCREVVATLAGEWQCSRQADGRLQKLLLKSEREWLLARIVEKPDLTLRAVVAELAERGTPASYGAVWRFFKHEGITFKKNSPRQRAGSRRHRSPPDPVEGVSGPA